MKTLAINQKQLHNEQQRGLRSSRRDTENAIQRNTEINPAAAQSNKTNDKEILELFKSFAVCWGERWTKNINDGLIDHAIHVWGRAISDLPKEKILAGLRHCISTLDYPPSIAQFRRSCLGVVSARVAFALAANQTYCNIYAHRAYTSIPTFDRAQLTREELFYQFAAKYNHLCDEAVQIHEL
jgi:hypothetical protein